jgi:hypothetical protein
MKKKITELNEGDRVNLVPNLWAQVEANYVSDVLETEHDVIFTDYVGGVAFFKNGFSMECPEDCEIVVLR